MSYYGIVKGRQCREFAQSVVDVLGGGPLAVNLLLETAAQETHLGQYRDPTPRYAGTGLCQVDLVSFSDIKKRTRSKHLDKILDVFGINLIDVDYLELESSPLLAFIFCRLHYKLKPEKIPVSLIDRAQYWKTHYNTRAGKGTPDEYIKNANALLYL